MSTLTMDLKNLLRLAENDLNNNYFDTLNAWRETKPGEDHNDSILIEFILDQFRQSLYDKGINLIIR